TFFADQEVIESGRQSRRLGLPLLLLGPLMITSPTQAGGPSSMVGLCDRTQPRRLVQQSQTLFGLFHRIGPGQQPLETRLLALFLLCGRHSRRQRCQRPRISQARCRKHAQGRRGRPASHFVVSGSWLVQRGELDLVEERNLGEPTELLKPAPVRISSVLF